MINRLLALPKRKIETYWKHMLIPIFDIILSMIKKGTREKWLSSLKNDHHLTCFQVLAFCEKKIPKH